MYHLPFVLQGTAMRPDATDEDRKWTFQRLNVYAIVAQVGWPTVMNIAFPEVFKLISRINDSRNLITDDATVGSSGRTSRRRPTNLQPPPLPRHPTITTGTGNAGKNISLLLLN